MRTDFLLGVLGGMGPLATVDFLHKLVLSTPAESDQAHVPMVVWNVPQIVDRQKALAGTGPSPLPQLLDAVARLNDLGCTCIVMPCNTVHHWYAPLAQASRAPFIHIVDAAIDALPPVGADGAPVRRVGLIATRGALQSRLYQDKLAARGLQAVLNTDAELDSLFTPGCYAIKRNALDEGGELLERAAQALVARGAQCLLLACTEVPVALAHRQSALLAIGVDPNQALAQAVVARWQAVLEASRG